MKVIKIGGGCLKDGTAAKVIVDLISQRGRGDIFVLSAFYGVTDILIAGIDLALAQESNIPDIITRLKGLHHSIIQSLIEDGNQKKQLSKTLSEVYAKLERYYYGISFTREATPRMKDMVATFGERISALVLAKALCAKGCDSEFVLPENLGIVSDGRFMDASALMEKTSANIRSWLDVHMTRDKILFVPGFYGVSEQAEITTFGRGGSDYSAAVVAAGAGAELLEIWKDTEGFMTADPDNIPHCRLIPTLTYEEAAELSYTGAGILHPRTVEPVKNAGIDIAIKNTYNPDAPGSLITRDVPVLKNVIKSVSYTTDVAILKISAPGVGARLGFLGGILSPISKAAINVKSVVTSQTCISLILSRKDIRRAHETVSAMEPKPFRKLSTVTDIALVSIVGKGLHNNRGIAAKCFSAVSKADVNIEMIVSGTSDAALYFVVKEKCLDDTIKALHHIFFDECGSNGCSD